MGTRDWAAPLSTMALPALVRVLIVDDTATVRLLLRQSLRLSGRFEVVGEAADGSDGIQQAARQQPDIILLDLAMPVMDGLQAIPHLARCAPGALIIALSAFHADATAAQAVALGAHAYIDKKFRPEELLRRIADTWDAAADRTLPGTRSRASRAVTVGAAGVDAAAEGVRSQFRLAFEHAPIGSALVTVEGRLAEVNRAFCRISGHTERDLLGRRLDHIAHPDDREVDARPLARLLAGGIASYQSEKRIIRADGGEVWVLLCRSVFGTGDRAGLTLTQIVDITDQKSRVHELQATNADLARSVADLSDFAAVAAHDLKSPVHLILGFGELLAGRHGGQLDDQGREMLTSVVTAARRMEVLIDDLLASARAGSAEQVPAGTGLIGNGGRDADTAPRKGLEILLVEDSSEHAKLIAALLVAAQAPSYHLRTAATVSDALTALRTSEVDCVLLDLALPDASGLEALAQVRAAAPLLAVVVITSSSDETLAFAAVREGAQDYLVKGRIDSEQLSRSIRWAVQRKALETDLAREALHDALTKLPNRTLLLDRLRSALARVERSGETLALLYLDLDDFKPVNDRLGHEVGDQVLAVVADRLRESMRPQDTAARLGGDEFVVLCEGFDDAVAGVEAVRARLEQVISAPITVGGHSVRVRASIGTATSGPSDAPETMLRRADAAMYRAKEARRG